MPCIRNLAFDRTLWEEALYWKVSLYLIIRQGVLGFPGR